MLQNLPVNWVTQILVLALSVIYYLWQKSKSTKGPPPGPSGYPIVGNIIPFSKSVKSGKLTEYLTEVHGKYGPIVSVNVGSQRFVFISDGKMMSELFRSKNSALRPFDTLLAVRILAAGVERGILFANGSSHEEMRKFSLLSFRDFGVGKKGVDEIVQTESSILCEHFEKVEKAGGVVKDIRMHLHKANANAIHQILFGSRREHDNPKWMKLMQDLDDLDNIHPFAFASNYFPIIQKFPALNRYLSEGLDERFTELNESAITYLKSQIEEHRSTYQESEIRDFVDLYIKYESENRAHYTPENIFATMLDLFKAGIFTVAATIVWALVYLVKHPETQKALQEEIDKVVGSAEFNRSDQAKLIKTRAFINEVHRISSIAFLTGPHTVAEQTEFNGYNLEHGDVIFGFLYAINNDKTYWKDPEDFRYERWIGDNGELLKHEGHFYPFSTGQRKCPGMQFANIQMLLIIVHFLQKFNFVQAKGYTGEGTFMKGFLRKLEDFRFKVIKRNS